MTHVNFGHLYLGNKMAGIPFFNARWFDSTAERLRAVPGVSGVFNPADEDRRAGFNPVLCPNGTLKEAAAFGFDRRRSLGADWLWISAFSNGMVAGPDWERSTGTTSEIACHRALGLPVWEAWMFFSRVNSGCAEDLFATRNQLRMKVATEALL